MSALLTPLGVVGLIAVLYVLNILANLSQRLGAVTKMRPYYRGFYAAMALMTVSILARIAGSSLVLSGRLNPLSLYDPLFLAFYHAPFVIAMIISVAVAWYYWNWLFKEKLL